MYIYIYASRYTVSSSHTTIPYKSKMIYIYVENKESWDDSEDNFPLPWVGGWFVTGKHLQKCKRENAMKFDRLHYVLSKCIESIGQFVC